jgi:hypothetical protein
VTPICLLAATAGTAEERSPELEALQQCLLRGWNTFSESSP